MHGRPRIDDLLDHELVVDRRAHPELGPTLSRMLGDGSVERVLPSIYCRPAPGWPIRVAAAVHWDPDAVICGRASAALSFWPELAVAEVDVATARARASAPGFRFCRREIAPELIWSRGGLRLTAPSLTALDLAATDVGGEAIDQVLRSRGASLADLEAAFASGRHRRGNDRRRRLLLDSRAEPWSAAERAAHRLLRSAGVTGWVANHPIRVRSGEQVSTYYLDICFRGARVAIEIDGRQYHDTAAAFENDRYRHNDVVIAGWRVLHFTWRMIDERPAYVIDTIKAILAGAGAGV